MASQEISFVPDPADSLCSILAKDFLEAYDQHYVRVKKFILAMVKDQWTADELIQETFMKVGDRMHTLKDPAKISSWIYRIAYNLCQDHFMGLKREKSMAGDFGSPFEMIECVPPQGALEHHQMGVSVQEKMKPSSRSFSFTHGPNPISIFIHVIHDERVVLKVLLMKWRPSLFSLIDVSQMDQMLPTRDKRRKGNDKR